jgi:hypothetical protein
MPNPNLDSTVNLLLGFRYRSLEDERQELLLPSTGLIPSFCSSSATTCARSAESRKLGRFEWLPASATNKRECPRKRLAPT